MRTLALSLIVLLLNGCGAVSGSPANGNPTPAPTPAPVVNGIVVTGIAVQGDLGASATVSVRSVPDQDPSPSAYRVAFSLDGGSSPTSLTRDPGGSDSWQADTDILTQPGGALPLHIAIGP